MYFKSDNGFVARIDLDFLKIENDLNFEKFSEILTMDIITKNEITQLIVMFDVFGSGLDFNYAFTYIAREFPFNKLDLNEMYCSIN